MKKLNFLWHFLLLPLLLTILLSGLFSCGEDVIDPIIYTPKQGYVLEDFEDGNNIIACGTRNSLICSDPGMWIVSGSSVSPSISYDTTNEFIAYNTTNAYEGNYVGRVEWTSMDEFDDVKMKMYLHKYLYGGYIDIDQYKKTGIRFYLRGELSSLSLQVTIGSKWNDYNPSYNLYTGKISNSISTNDWTQVELPFTIFSNGSTALSNYLDYYYNPLSKVEYFNFNIPNNSSGPGWFEIDMIELY